jgi:transcriptional regulator with XRE-family HTH domain
MTPPNNNLLRWDSLVAGDDLRREIESLRHDLTDREIERRAGLSKGQLAKITRSRRRRWVTLDTADRILCRAFGRPDALQSCAVYDRA